MLHTYLGHGSGLSRISATLHLTFAPCLPKMWAASVVSFICATGNTLSVSRLDYALNASVRLSVQFSSLSG